MDVRAPLGGAKVVKTTYHFAIPDQDPVDPLPHWRWIVLQSWIHQSSAWQDAWHENLDRIRTDVNTRMRAHIHTHEACADVYMLSCFEWWSAGGICENVCMIISTYLSWQNAYMSIYARADPFHVPAFSPLSHSFANTPHLLFKISDWGWARLHSLKSIRSMTPCDDRTRSLSSCARNSSFNRSRSLYAYITSETDSAINHDAHHDHQIHACASNLEASRTICKKKRTHWLPLLPFSFLLTFGHYFSHCHLLSPCLVFFRGSGALCILFRLLAALLCGKCQHRQSLFLLPLLLCLYNLSFECAWEWQVKVTRFAKKLINLCTHAPVLVGCIVLFVCVHVDVYEWNVNANSLLKLSIRLPGFPFPIQTIHAGVRRSGVHEYEYRSPLLCTR